MKYTEELKNFFIGFKNLPQETQNKLLNFAGIEPSNLDDFISEIAPENNLDRILEEMDDLSTDETVSVFDKCFSDLDLDTMNATLKQYGHQIISADDLEEELDSILKTVHELKDRFNND